MKRFFAALIVVMIVFCGIACAIPKPTDDFYVYDGPDVLSDETEGMIVFSNDLLKSDCGAQFVVVVVDSTEGKDISDYAYELINDWKIGDKTKQNGFLMLLAIKDENYYFEPGTGLSESMSWGKIKGIVDEYLEPDFAKGKYDEGVNKVYRQLFKKLASVEGSSATVEAGIEKYNEYISEPGYEPEEVEEPTDVSTSTGKTGYNYSPEPVRKNGAGSIMGYVVVIIIIVVIILLISSRGRRSKGYRGVFWMMPPRTPPVYRPTVPPPTTRTAPRPPMGGTGSQPTRPMGGIGGGVGTSRPSTRTSGGGLFGSGRSTNTTPRSFGTNMRPSGTSSNSRSFSSGSGSGSRSFGSGSGSSRSGGLFGGSRSSGGGRSFGGRSGGGFGGGRSGGGGGSRGGGGGRGR